MGPATERVVSASEFKNRAGLYLEKAATGAVVITRYDRPSRVLIDYAEFQHLKELARHRPTREAMPVEELPQDAVDALRAADFSHIDPELNKLME